MFLEGLKFVMSEVPLELHKVAGGAVPGYAEGGGPWRGRRPAEG